MNAKNGLGVDRPVAKEAAVSPALVSILASMVEGALRDKDVSVVASEANEDASEEPGS